MNNHMRNLDRMHKAINILTVVAIFVFAFLPILVGAQTDIFPPGTQPAGYSTESTFGQLVIKIAQILLAVVGMVAVIFFLYGAFRYITSAGDEERLKGAKSTMVNALIGVVLVLLAFALVRKIASATRRGTEGL